MNKLLESMTAAQLNSVRKPYEDSGLKRRYVIPEEVITPSVVVSYPLFPKPPPTEPVVLRGMDIDIDVIDACYRAWVTQAYVNDHEAPIEAVYKLLLPKSVNVTKFQVEIDGYTIKGLVKEKEEAKDDYDDAISQGQSAFVMEQSQSNSGNLYEISVGNLGPGASATVGFELLSVVAFKSGEYVLEIPVEIFPTSTVDMNVNVRFNTSAPVMECAGLVEKSLGYSDQTFNWSGESLTTSLLIGFQTERGEPSIIIEEDEDSKNYLMINYFPDWDAVEEDMVEAQCDVIFLVDRSGSMRGDRIKYTRNALNILIHAIPPNSKFNVVSFGGRFTKLFKESMPYDDDSLSQASKDVNSMEANYGGTDLISPLQSILNEKSDLDYPRTIFILTDGQVNDTHGTIALVKRFSEYCRVFVLGISTAVDKALVKGLADAGNGAFDFVAKADNIEDVTMNLFMQVLVPSYRDISLEIPDNYSQVPSTIKPMRNGERLLAFGEPKDEAGQIDISSIIIKATDPYGDNAQMILNNVKRIQGDIVKKFVVLSKIKELEELGNQKKEIIRLSIKYQIPTKLTAFVAVDDRDNDSVIEHTMKSTVITTQSSSSTIEALKGPKPGGRSRGRGGGGSRGGNRAIHSRNAPQPTSISYQNVSTNRNSLKKEKKTLSLRKEVSNEYEDGISGYINSSYQPQMSSPPPPVSAPLSRMSEMTHSMKNDWSFYFESEMESELRKKSTTPHQGDDIIQMQKAEGYWALEDIAHCFNKQLSEIESANPFTDNILVWATALALAYMEKSMSDTKNRWLLVARKGIRFIKKELKGSSISYTELESIAQVFVEGL